MDRKDDLHNRLKAVRTRLGMSQQDLATAAGIARQTIGGVEAGTYALSLAVALRLARALGCPIEELFWLEGEPATVEAQVIGISGNVKPEASANPQPVRVALARVGERWVASQLVGDSAFRAEMVPADGIAEGGVAGTCRVQLLDSPQALTDTVLVAGCTPALSLWARSAERWHPGLRVNWFHANSTVALKHLTRGEVHLAGVHLADPTTGAENDHFVREAMGGIPCALVNLGVWEEGLIVAAGNPKKLTSVADLARPDVTLINREAGAGSRLLLDALLAQARIASSQIAGYERITFGHLEVAREIASGQADAGVSTASVAATYGLAFVPLRPVRYDLALRQEFLTLPSLQHLLETLSHRGVRAQLALLGGYDTTQTGEIRMVE